MSPSPDASTRARWRVCCLLLVALMLTACETVTETLVMTETGAGSLIIDWTYDPGDPEQVALAQAAGFDSPPIRDQLGAAMDDAFDMSGYELTDQAAFIRFRGDRTGFTVTQPLSELEDLETLGQTELATGRVPSMLWHDIELSTGDGTTVALTAAPDVEARQQLLDHAASQGVEVGDMVFVAAFEVRGQILSHNADEVDGGRLRWRIAGTEERTLDVSWQPVTPDSQSPAPFAAGLIALIALITGGLYWWEKRNLDRVENMADSDGSERRQQRRTSN